MRAKTVEIIVEKTAWQPSALKFADKDLVAVRIGFAEKSLIVGEGGERQMKSEQEVVVHPVWEN